MPFGGGEGALLPGPERFPGLLDGLQILPQTLGLHAHGARELGI